MSGSCSAELGQQEKEKGGKSEQTHESPGDENTAESEPRDDPELGLVVDVVVEDGRSESTELSDGGRDSVGGGTNRGGEALGGDEEGNAVGSELVEERGHEVHELEDLDVRSGLLELLEEDGSLLKKEGQLRRRLKKRRVILTKRKKMKSKKKPICCMRTRP